MGVRARLRAVCVVANPRNSQAIAVVCASQPIPNRSPHTFIRDHEHVLRTRATNALTHLATIQRGHANRHEMLAQSLRAQLREARDLAALRCAGLALLQAVQSHAGEERAATLREQLRGLLDEAPQAQPA